VGVAFELVGGLVAHQLEGVASLDQRLPFGRQALQFDKSCNKAAPFSSPSAAIMISPTLSFVSSGRKSSSQAYFLAASGKGGESAAVLIFDTH
jgi:hypothetical protein